MHKRVLPPDHPEIAKMMASLAAMYIRLERHGEALQLLEGALAIQSKSLPASHADVAATKLGISTLRALSRPLENPNAIDVIPIATAVKLHDLRSAAQCNGATGIVTL